MKVALKSIWYNAKIVQVLTPFFVFLHVINSKRNFKTAKTSSKYVKTKKLKAIEIDQKAMNF